MPKFIKEHVDSMILGAGHSLMVANTPQGLDIQLLSDNFVEHSNIRQTADSFGFFGGGLNYHTFYPEVTQKDFNPEKDDYIEPTFRMLSACVVAKGYNPTDFSKPGVLKSAMSKLLGQTVNCDHETDVGNAIGSVAEVAWQDAYTDKQTGFKIPAGINAMLRIDAKSNPRIARGINMDPPSIHSNSVTVQFKWEPSHQYEKEWEFYNAIGTVHADGTIVRRIVTEIIAFKETSLVSHGADPFAQIIKEGKIINPSYAGSQYYSLSEEKQKSLADELKNNMFSMDYKSFSKESIMYNTTDSIIERGNQTPNNNQNQNMEQLEKFLESLIGDGMLTLSEGAEKLTPEMVVSQLKELASSNSILEQTVTTLTAEKEALSSEITSLKETLEANKNMVTIGTDHLKQVRETALGNYRKLYGDNVDNTLIALLESPDTGLATLVSLDKSYVVSLEEKFPMACTKCGSKDISRASSKEEDEEDVEDDELNEEGVVGTLERLAEKKRLGDKQ